LAGFPTFWTAARTRHCACPRADAAAVGRFRQNLLCRLESFTVHPPPLREPRENVPALAELQLNQLAVKHGRKPPTQQPSAYRS
jgi:DNA-binding NtrC family response regulator